MRFFSLLVAGSTLPLTDPFISGWLEGVTRLAQNLLSFPLVPLPLGLRGNYSVLYSAFCTFISQPRLSLPQIT
jgi:hypothetical protein